MPRQTTSLTRGRGRPREFDLDQALDKAMLLFWEKGYDEASLAELASVMGITKPSLYAAFTDKQSLFKAALDRYADGPHSFAARAFQLPTAREIVLALLEGTVNISTLDGGPRGCLFTHATMAQSPEAREEAIRKSQHGERMLAKRLRAAQEAGELPPQVDCAAFARYVQTVAIGITVQGASGAAREQLKKVVIETMAAWPGSPSPSKRLKK